MDPDGGNPRQLTLDPLPKQLPDFSPDGARIAYATTPPASSDIWTIGVDGTGVRRVTDDPELNFSPSWSPDGSEIVYRRIVNGINRLYVTGVDGTDTRALAPDVQGHQLTPAWQSLPSD